jgi:hypothetical protein
MSMITAIDNAFVAIFDGLPNSLRGAGKRKWEVAVTRLPAAAFGGM